MNPDEDARERIRTDLAETLFVEAGAGSGKTRSLVERIVALVAGGTPIRHIAAVTFTEKAAAELRDRLRVELTRGGHDDALDDLDGAAIGTLHSFARRILSEHAVEAGLPPLVEVLDPVASRVAADRRYDELQTELLDDRAAAPVLRLALAAGIRLDHLRALANAFDGDWDLVDERVPTTLPPRPRLDVDTLRRQADNLVAMARHCDTGDDKLRLRLDEVQDWRTKLDGADEAEALGLLADVPRPHARLGQKGNWNGRIDDVRDALKELHTEATDAADTALDDVIRWLVARIGRRVIVDARTRAAGGRLQFHDLLVLARDLLRREPGVRASLQDRYRRLLLDEFQDTDRLQIEIAVRIAGGAAADAPRWEDVQIPAGSSFVVGDPKQSIYRFRRADIRTYLQARSIVTRPVELSTNFRSTRTILDWVNTTFTALMRETEGAQPAFHPLAPAPDAADGEPVLLLGRDVDHASVAEARDREATDIAALVATALCESWTVRDPGTKQDRPVRADDITVLVPTRTAIGGLETAFDSLEIAYRTEAATFVYSAPEVRELMGCLRAVDDETNQLAVIATLRSSLFGCDARQLWEWKAAGGSWNPFAPAPHAGPVADAMAVLAGWTRRRSRLAPSELLDDILRPAARSKSPSTPPATARRGGGCGSSSTRPAPGRTPNEALCANTSPGRRGRPRTTPASSRPTCLNGTAKPSGSPPSTPPKASSSPSSCSPGCPQRSRPSGRLCCGHETASARSHSAATTPPSTTTTPTASTKSWRTTNGSGCSTSPRPAPPAASRSHCTERQRLPRRPTRPDLQAGTGRHRPMSAPYRRPRLRGTTSPVGRMGFDPLDSAGGSETTAGGVGDRHRPRPGHGAAAVDRARGTRQTAARPRAEAVAQRAVRNGDRPRGARRPADPPARDRRRPRGSSRRAGARRGRARRRRRDHERGSFGPRLAGTPARGHTTPLAGDLRRHRGRRHPRRGLRRPALPRRRRTRPRRLQDRPGRRPGRARGLRDPARRVRPRHRRRHRRTRRPLGAAVPTTRRRSHPPDKP